MLISNFGSAKVALMMCVAFGSRLLKCPAFTKLLQNLFSVKIQFVKQSLGHSCPLGNPGIHLFVLAHHPMAFFYSLVK